MYHLRFPSLGDRTAFISHLAKHGIKAVFHYQPLHLSEYGRRYGFTAGSCHITERTSDQLVRLPLYYDLTDSQLTDIIDCCMSL
jgi:dTDP-4-amino-4,6-dideoxygalactose transaminase